MAKILGFLVCCLCLFGNAASYADTQQWVFDEISETEFHQEVKLLIESAYQSLDIQIKYLSHPLARSYRDASLGRLSGLMARVEDREHQFPDLVRIPEPIANFEIVLVVNQSLCRDCSISELRKIATVRKFAALKHYLNTQKLKLPLLEVPNRRGVFKLMEGKRVDAMIVSRVLLPQSLLDTNIDWQVMHLTDDVLYHYIHKSQ